MIIKDRMEGQIRNQLIIGIIGVLLMLSSAILILTVHTDNPLLIILQLLPEVIGGFTLLKAVG
jgi:hypothetical protein